MEPLPQTQSLGSAARADSFWLRGQSCDLVGIRRSDDLLVSFDNLAAIDERADTPPWTPWLAKRAEMLDLSILGVQSHAKDWYRTPEPPEQIAELQAQGYFDRFRNVVFTGTSMGGFAALCFAGLAPGARVLAFSPQSTLNRDIAPFERRYPWPYRKYDWDDPAFLDASEHLDTIDSGLLFFDPMVQEDRLHAARLQAPGIQQIRLPWTGHTLIRSVAKAGALEHLLRVYVTEGRLDAEFFRLMRAKRENARWAKTMLRHLSEHASPARQRRAASYFAARHDYRFARRMLRGIDGAAAPAPGPRIDYDGDARKPEGELRRTIPVFVNSYNQLTYLRDTLDWFARHGFENVTVLDNRSGYPPLLDYYNSAAFRARARLARLDENMGPRRALAHAAQSAATDGGFVFTDPDLTLPDPPAPDLLTRMFDVGRRHGFVKVGLALSIDPEIVDVDRVTYNTRTVAQVERKYWKKAVEPGVFEATTDTTFFVYVPREGEGKRFNDYGLRQARIPSIRVGQEGFVALHRPWLRRDDVDPEEMAYYFAKTKAHSTYVVAQKAAGAKGGRVGTATGPRGREEPE